MSKHTFLFVIQNKLLTWNLYFSFNFLILFFSVTALSVHCLCTYAPVSLKWKAKSNQEDNSRASNCVKTSV